MSKYCCYNEGNQKIPPFLMKRNSLHRIFLPQSSVFSEVISYYMAERFSSTSIFS